MAAMREAMAKSDVFGVCGTTRLVAGDWSIPARLTYSVRSWCRYFSAPGSGSCSFSDLAAAHSYVGRRRWTGF